MRSTLKYDIIDQNYGGLLFMKTKIIYISGSEVFEMADVRAAFDEVRGALGLGRDTVLFGVPVDNDDALAKSPESVAMPATEHIESSTANIVDENINIESEVISETNMITEPAPTEIESDFIATATPMAEIEEQITTPEFEEHAPAPVEEAPAPIKKSRGRPRKVAVAPAESPAAQTETTKPAPAPEQPSEKVIPILSVLSANNVAPQMAEPAKAPVEIEEPASVDAPNDAPKDITDVATEEPEFIDDLINDQVPEEPEEKTLEQLLESMTPLREDHSIPQPVDTPDDMVEMTNEYDTATPTDTDATLEQLAAEFADTQDKIASPAPTSTHGKIGKLKNILPFKKARRDDTGLMGDLFGWAGVAANDEDFTIPGFFTTAAKK